MLTPIPDASAHNPEPGYFRSLLNKAGMTYADAATKLNISERTVKRYAAVGGFGYGVQFVLECYAARLDGIAELVMLEAASAK